MTTPVAGALQAMKSSQQEDALSPILPSYALYLLCFSFEIKVDERFKAKRILKVIFSHQLHNCKKFDEGVTRCHIENDREIK